LASINDSLAKILPAFGRDEPYVADGITTIEEVGEKLL